MVPKAQNLAMRVGECRVDSLAGDKVGPVLNIYFIFKIASSNGESENQSAGKSV